MIVKSCKLQLTTSSQKLNSLPAELLWKMSKHEPKSAENSLVWVLRLPSYLMLVFCGSSYKKLLKWCMKRVDNAVVKLRLKRL
jgi:hypothetical protein